MQHFIELSTYVSNDIADLSISIIITCFFNAAQRTGGDLRFCNDYKPSPTTLEDDELQDGG